MLFAEKGQNHDGRADRVLCVLITRTVSTVRRDVGRDQSEIYGPLETFHDSEEYIYIYICVLHLNYY